jgi:hypothetical protein
MTPYEAPTVMVRRQASTRFHSSMQPATSDQLSAASRTRRHRHHVPSRTIVIAASLCIRCTGSHHFRVSAYRGLICGSRMVCGGAMSASGLLAPGQASVPRGRCSPPQQSGQREACAERQVERSTLSTSRISGSASRDRRRSCRRIAACPQRRASARMMLTCSAHHSSGKPAVCVVAAGGASFQRNVTSRMGRTGSE